LLAIRLALQESYNTVDTRLRSKKKITTKPEEKSATLAVKPSQFRGQRAIINQKSKILKKLRR
jgi:hypothetical protein